MTVQWIKPKSQKPFPISAVETIPKRGVANFQTSLKVNSPLPSVAEEKLPTRGSVNWAGPKSQKPAPAEVTEAVPKRSAIDWNTIVTEPTIETPVAKNLVHEHVKHNVTKILRKFMSR